MSRGWEGSVDTTLVARACHGDVEAFEELVTEPGIDPAGQVTQQLEALCAGELRPQRHVTGHV